MKNSYVGRGRIFFIVMKKKCISVGRLKRKGLRGKEMNYSNFMKGIKLGYYLIVELFKDI